MAAGDESADELLQACLTAPKHGLNAKALILQAALAGNDSSDEDGERRAEAGGSGSSEGRDAAKRKLPRDAAAEAAAAAARRGGEYLAAVPATQRPLVPFLNRSKIPRIHRQTVLSKLAGEHLALAAHRREPPLEPTAAAADAELRKVAWDAALAQEKELFQRCGSTVVYQNLAARTSATQWAVPQAAALPQPAAAVPAAQLSVPEPLASAQQGAALQSVVAGRGAGEAQQAAQQAQQAEQGGERGDEGRKHGPNKRQRCSSGQVASKQAASAQRRLEAVDIDWDSAVPDSQAGKVQADEYAGRSTGSAGEGADQLSKGKGPAGSGGATQGSAARPSEQTEVGNSGFKPLRGRLGAAPALGSATEPGGAAAQTAQAAAAAAAPDAGPRVTPGTAAAADAAGESGRAPSSGQQQDGAMPAAGGLRTGLAAARVEAAAAAAAPASSTVAAAPEPALDAVRHSVELLIRAELHPLLKRGHISRQLCDAVTSKCAAKVMARHACARSADFLVAEAVAIRALAHQYLEHMRQRQRGQP